MLRLFGVLAGVAVLAAACQWPMVRFGPERTGYSPSETTISPANVGQLTEQWTASLAGPGTDPIVDNGDVFVTAGNGTNADVYSFAAQGTSCTAGSPAPVCQPAWSVPFSANPDLSASVDLSAPGASQGDVYVGDYATIAGFPAITNIAAYNENTGAQSITMSPGGTSSPDITNGLLYATVTNVVQPPPSPASIGPYLEAFDATTGAGQFVADVNQNFPQESFTDPTVANGVLYATSGNTLYAFDATGATNCGPVPSPYNEFIQVPLCQPLWSASMTGTSSQIAAVANGYVYIGDSTGTLYAFPAGGCGAATCSASWTASTGGAIESSAAVTSGTVYVGSDDGNLYAFPAAGCGAATCQPLWTATIGGAVKSSPSVAGSVVYVGSEDDNLYAFDASGCGAATCQALWSTNVGAPIETSPAISNGQVFVTDTAGTLHAYGLPAGAGS